MDVLVVESLGASAKTKYMNVVMYITMPAPPRVVMTEIIFRKKKMNPICIIFTIIKHIFSGSVGLMCCYVI